MAVSLGTRISGLLVVGAVAVAAAAFTGDGSGSTENRGDGGTTVTAAPTSRPPAALPSSGLASPIRPRPEGHVAAPASTAPPTTPEVVAPTSAPTSPSPSPSKTHQVLEVPDWLPPGPDSPDTDGTPDPASVYDLLRDPAECDSALNLVPPTAADAEWTLLRGLASACLAVQGEGAGWEQAVRAKGGGDSCKGRAAYAVLGGLLDFHRRHPGATVRLKPSASAAPACAYRIAGVDTGGDGTAMPGEAIGIELADPYFDRAELLRSGSVFIGGQQVPVVSDRVGLWAVVPVVEAGLVAVVVRYGGTEVRLADAFTVAVPSDLSESPLGARGTARPATTQPADNRQPTAAKADAPAQPTPG